MMKLITAGLLLISVAVVFAETDDVSNNEGQPESAGGVEESSNAGSRQRRLRPDVRSQVPHPYSQYTPLYQNYIPSYPRYPPQAIPYGQSPYVNSQYQQNSQNPYQQYPQNPYQQYPQNQYQQYLYSQYQQRPQVDPAVYQRYIQYIQQYLQANPDLLNQNLERSSLSNQPEEASEDDVVDEFNTELEEDVDDDNDVILSDE